MAKPRVASGGGWAAIRYTFKKGSQAGGLRKLFRALDRPTACKTCALGMGGKAGGMRNELGEKLQVCKKSLQAQAQDMMRGIPAEFFAHNRLEDLEKFSGRELEALGRLVDPLFKAAGATHFQVLKWPQAFELLIDRWRQARPDRSFFYTSGRSSNEAAFLAQLLARQWGTNNVNNCSYYCHQASGVGLARSLGGGTATVQLHDLGQADLLVLIGANPASNHPRLMTQLVKLRRRGGQVIVVNPFRELGLEQFRIPSDMRSLFFGSKIADLYVQPHAGGDLAFLKAAAVKLLQDGQADVQFLRTYCNGFDEFSRNLHEASLPDLLERSGISEQVLADFCRKLAASTHTIFAWAMGITHHTYGTQNVQAIANLALMRGMVGKPGAGLLPIRGHSNVQGVGTVGVVPKLKPAMAEALVRELGLQVPDQPGLDTYACMEAAYNGKIDFAVLLGGNLFAANPDQKWAGQALQRIDFTLHCSTTLNSGHIFGTGKSALILPVRVRDEEEQSTSQESMFNFVRLSQGGRAAPAGELPAESAIFARLGRELFGKSPVPWHELHEHHQIRRFIARTAPGMAPLAKIEQNEFTIPGRTKHTPHFDTPDGKANLAVLQAPDARPATGTFNLLTFRSEGQFNTIVYEEEDIYRGSTHRQVVFMHGRDIAALGASEGSWVHVESAAGAMRAEVLEAPIRPGNVAMFYPEANAIVPRAVDPQSRTPAFKRVPVRIALVETGPATGAAPRSQSGAPQNESRS